MSQPPLPLDDLRILDLTHFYNGPYATMLLSYLGAAVTKIEAPEIGDGARQLFRRKRDPFGIPFAMMNANKRSVTLNLKSAEGQEIFKRLVEKADLVVENFAAGTMDAMGLGFEVLRTVNPRLIYACSTGYGQTGPKRNLAAFDPVVQAMSGIMALTGEPNGPPTKAGPAVVDFLGAVHLCAGILGAIRQRDRTGQGLMVELSLYESAIPALTSYAGAYFGLGIKNLREGNRAPGGAIVPYSTYPASDGWVLIMAGDNRRWQQLCRVMGRADLAADERLTRLGGRIKNTAEIDAAITAWTSARTRQQIMDDLAANDIFCGIVKEYAEVMSDPHLFERGTLRHVEHPQLGPMTLLTSPVRLNGQPNAPQSPAPALGQHTDEFYRDELGLSAAEIASLRERKVI